jgi:hypothetical protein
VGTVGCRRYNSYIYTECIGNNSRGGGGYRDGAQVLVYTIENVAIHRRKQVVMGRGGSSSTVASRYMSQRHTIYTGKVFMNGE